jgi:SsrA-binding protein
MSSKDKSKDRRKVLNREAFRDYEILEKFEAGIELRGTEVKSVRAGSVSLKGSFARVISGELFVINMNISPYEQGNIHNHEPTRQRRLLVHKREILKLQAAVEQKGHSIVPLSVYFKGSRVKLELGVGRGKTMHDKRETIKRKAADREAARAVARSTRR